MHLVAGPMNGSMSFLQLPDLALDNDGDTGKKIIPSSFNEKLITKHFINNNCYYVFTRKKILIID